MTINEYIIEDTFSYLIIKSSSHGVISFVVDTDDLDNIKKYTWCIQRCKHTDCNTMDKYYAKATSVKNLLLHRFLTNAKKGEIVNHINGNTLDMRKKNLQKGTYSDNNRNVIRIKNSSGRVGVTWTKNVKKWHAYINHNGKQINLGYFSDKSEAIKAREQAENLCCK